tara:strand:+ start:374 stop:505 length:132 start_codon:yes stop_codon:yes gene_type:complete
VKKWKYFNQGSSSPNEQLLTLNMHGAQLTESDIEFISYQPTLF